MARRKDPSPQLGLGLVESPSPPPAATIPLHPLRYDMPTADLATVDLEEFDDYDEQKETDGIRHLRLVDPIQNVRVLVEAIDADTFEVSRLRNNGTTVATVRWTRDELKELIGRIEAALEVASGEEKT